MKDVNTLCIACMNDKGNNAFCPHCGFQEDSYTPPPHHLRPGTILNGKYWVGKALGEGGFGITYIGWDLNLELKTAIKEYFPNGFVSRDVSVTDTLTVFSGSDQNMFEQGREKFINEAKSLARFDSLPGIVSVKDFFLENGTAYIVMEYVDGETLKSFLKRNGGKASPETVFTMMEPLMKSLSKVHEQGIIHRDISPDNIMITKDSKVKLLDFGAARDISMSGQKSLSIQLKPGYAPEEQYRSHGKQGPWTDVYALCATMYMAITGVQPMESLERMHSDRVQPPSLLGIAINPSQEAALMHGMSVYAANRTPDVTQLYNELYGGGNYNYTHTPDPVSTYTDTNSSTRPLLLAVAVGGGIALAVPYNICGCYNHELGFIKRQSADDRSGIGGYADSHSGSNRNAYTRSGVFIGYGVKRAPDRHGGRTIFGGGGAVGRQNDKMGAFQEQQRRYRRMDSA